MHKRFLLLLHSTLIDVSHGQTICCHAFTSSALYREDALAAMQLYQLHVKDDPELMTYQELVEHELRDMVGTVDSKI